MILYLNYYKLMNEVRNEMLCNIKVLRPTSINVLGMHDYLPKWIKKDLCGISGTRLKSFFLIFSAKQKNYTNKCKLKVNRQIHIALI